MTHQPAPERGSGSGRLWTDPREEDEHQQWLAPKTTIMPVQPLREPVQPPQEPPRRSLWPLILVATAVAVGLFGAGVLGANLLFNDDEPSRDATALPAAPGSVAPSARSRVARRAGPSVVLVRVQEGGSRSSGTGFLIDDSNGTIVTAAHVVDGARHVSVRFDDKGEDVAGEVLDSDESSDLAVVRVNASETKGIRPLALADSDAVRVGDPVIAIGYPLGLDRSVTSGIVSGVGRAIRARNGFSINKVIQTDASINAGNSGGPLLDGLGRVIGVNSQIATTSGGGGNIGIGFAVPSNTVREVVPQLERGRSIERAYLGVRTQASTVDSGALVAGVVGGSPAEGDVQVGDIIVKVDGKDIDAPEDVSAAIQARKPGDEIDVEVQRAGGRRTVRVTLARRPENPSVRP